jgi:hypothetical protein
MCNADTPLPPPCPQHLVLTTCGLQQLLQCAPVYVTGAGSHHVEQHLANASLSHKHAGNHTREDGKPSTRTCVHGTGLADTMSSSTSLHQPTTNVAKGG